MFSGQHHRNEELPFPERSALMTYSQGNPGSGNGQPGWPGHAPQQSYDAQGYAPQGYAPQQSYPPQQPAGVAVQGNGIAWARWSGVAVAVGALLPFIGNIQETVDGTAFGTGNGISGGGRFASFLFGALLVAFTLWSRYRPALGRRIAIASLITAALGFAGYCIFTVIGFVGISVQVIDGTTAQETWDPSIGALLSIAGCAACAIAAIAVLRTSPRR
jgi:hypothetical protein